MNDFKIRPLRTSSQRRLLEEAKPHYTGAIIAAIAALGSAAMSSSATSDAASKAAGAAAMPKPNQQPFTPTANAFAAPGQKGIGAELSTGFSKSALPELPQGQNAADVFRVADALGKTDLSSGQGAPPPIPGSAAAPATDFGAGSPATDFGAGKPTIGAAEASLPAGGTTSGAGSDWLSKAQTYAQLGDMARNALSPPGPTGGGIPAAAPMTYNPTANAAIQRLQQLLAQRRGF